jgi:hypothetical protein
MSQKYLTSSYFKNRITDFKTTYKSSVIIVLNVLWIFQCSYKSCILFIVLNNSTVEIIKIFLFVFLDFYEINMKH